MCLLPCPSAGFLEALPKRVLYVDVDHRRACDNISLRLAGDDFVAQWRRGVRDVD